MSLTLEDVEQLGGTKEEFELLAGVDDTGSEMEFGEEGKKGDISRAKIEEYILSIGLGTGAIGKDGGKNRGAGGEGEGGGRRSGEKRKKGQEREEKQENKKINKRKKSSASGDTAVVPSLPAQSSQTQVGVGVLVAGKDVEQALLGVRVTPHTKLLLSPDSELPWFELADTKDPPFPVSMATLGHISSVGAELMKTEVQLYEKVREKRKGAGDVRWLNNVLSSGTLGDKVAAHTLLVQESPVHSLSSLDWLQSLVARGGSNMKGLHAKRTAILATNTLKELWVSDLLPEHRKLKSLKQRPLDHLTSMGSSSSHHSLLLWYFEDQLKNRYLDFITILKHSTHDPVQEVREKMLGHVFDLLFQRPEQEQLLLTQLVNKLGDPHRRVGSRAVMFLLKLLNHHVNMKGIVAREIECLLHRPNVSLKAQYYGVCCLNQIVFDPGDSLLVAKLIDIYFTFFKAYINKDQLDSKMLAALLTGVNRAFPYMKQELPSFEDHLHSLFKVVHVGPISTGVQSLMLLYQVMESRRSVSSRYYNALYAKLLDPALKHCNRQAMFLNVLFKSLKSDPSMNRLKAFVKRVLQVCSYHLPPFVCGSLVLLSELLKEKAALWPYILQANDEEVFMDVPVDGSSSKPEVEDARVREMVKPGADGYKIGHRNPQFSGAEYSCLWELRQLCEHYHPSVQLFATKIASGELISYSGDPLADFTLIKFLDRFVYKNPKLKESDHGGSAMQRIVRGEMKSDKSFKANTAQFAALDESEVDVKDLFIHRYFTQTAVRQRVKKRKKAKKEEEEREEGAGGVGQEAEDAYMDMDFARELQKEVKQKSKPSKKRTRKEAEEDEEGFDYDAMDDDVWGGSEGEEEEEGEGEMSEAQLEKLLLQNISDEEEGGMNEDEEEREEEDELEDREPPKSRRLHSRSGFDSSQMFAAADEFAGLLEGSARHEDKGQHAKQLAWENRQSRRPPKRGGTQREESWGVAKRRGIQEGGGGGENRGKGDRGGRGRRGGGGRGDRRNMQKQGRVNTSWQPGTGKQDGRGRGRGRGWKGGRGRGGGRWKGRGRGGKNRT